MSQNEIIEGFKKLGFRFHHITIPEYDSDEISFEKVNKNGREWIVFDFSDKTYFDGCLEMTSSGDMLTLTVKKTMEIHKLIHAQLQLLGWIDKEKQNE